MSLIWSVDLPWTVTGLGMPPTLLALRLLSRTAKSHGNVRTSILHICTIKPTEFRIVSAIWDISMMPSSNCHSEEDCHT